MTLKPIGVLTSMRFHLSAELTSVKLLLVAGAALFELPLDVFWGGVRMNMGRSLLSYRAEFRQLVYNRQIGLGSNVTLDTITVPTEVNLWRMVPTGTSSKCLNVTAGTSDV